MVMDIATALAGLRTINEIAKALMSTKSENERQAKSAELQNVINAVLLNAITIQSEESKIREENKALKEELARVKQWKEEKKRYRLVNVFDESVVYALRKDMSNNETPHYICTSCYDNGKRSILNPLIDNKENNGFLSYNCPSCKAKVRTIFRGGIAPKFAEELVRN